MTAIEEYRAHLLKKLGEMEEALKWNQRRGEDGEITMKNMGYMYRKAISETKIKLSYETTDPRRFQDDAEIWQEVGGMWDKHFKSQSKKEATE